RKLAGTLRLAPGSAVLDVGCGTGADTVALADLVSPGGRAVGVDVSAVMIEEARRRAARRDRSGEVRVGRAEGLGLPDRSFDACRFERVLQHLPSPAAALREAARVLRPGGRLAAFEPDWTSLEISGANPEVTARILKARSRGIASPDVGAGLPDLVSGAGFIEVHASEVPIATSSLRLSLRGFRLEASAQAAVACGAVSSADAAAWLKALSSAARTRAFRLHVTGHLVAGTR